MINAADLHRIGPQHLQRAAIVYVRQSDPQQVREHTESTELQRGLRDKAVELGWPKPLVIEDDLGITASGFAERPGFQSLLTQVTMREIGFILCIEASRLSRNSADWAQLFELCGYFDTLVADQQQIYDVSMPNDRLVLQIKGTVAELELSNMKSRLRAGFEGKAARGELKCLLPVGYVYDANDKLVIDPDERVQQAIRSMFERFEHATSVRQLAMSYRDSNTLFPVKKHRRKGTIVWELPRWTLFENLISHPIFAGVYAHGRTKTYIDYVGGKLTKRTRRLLAPEDWKVCIHDHHEPYISWQQYLANQAKSAEGRPRWLMRDNRCAVREGRALLAGLLRCGHCGRKLRVIYDRKSSAQYYCDGAETRGTKGCLAFGAKYVDERVGEQLCKAVEPLALEAAEAALRIEQHEHEQAIEQARLRVQAAHYAADRAFEQYDLADPKNRLVVSNLEQRLNAKLAEVKAAEHELEECLVRREPLTKAQRQALAELTHDLRNRHGAAQTAVAHCLA